MDALAKAEKDDDDDTDLDRDGEAEAEAVLDNGKGKVGVDDAVPLFVAVVESEKDFVLNGVREELLDIVAVLLDTVDLVGDTLPDALPDDETERVPLLDDEMVVVTEPELVIFALADVEVVIETELVDESVRLAVFDGDKLAVRVKATVLVTVGVPLTQLLPTCERDIVFVAVTEIGLGTVFDAVAESVKVEIALILIDVEEDIEPLPDTEGETEERKNGESVV